MECKHLVSIAPVIATQAGSDFVTTMKKVNKFFMVPIEKYERWQQQQHPSIQSVPNEVSSPKEVSHTDQKFDGVDELCENMDDEKDILKSEDIVNTLPKHLKFMGQSLVEYLMKHEVSWNNRGELVYEGQTYSQTNIADLVRDALIVYKAFTPEGSDIFYQIIASNNVPLSLITNPDRRSKVMELRYSKNPKSSSSADPVLHKRTFQSVKVKKPKSKSKWINFSIE